ncbi:D-glycero-alpha-D-manno-heptose-1,7-bisphosphate 7-phosphatase [Ornithinibacillus bavariensis]|uniref:D,D-heptose 1,7-bisphosphate phosphatase n=1 Tax=Ornithinibacillus bavariensis TaxID=545502 RepID=A0A919X7W3_9BACI|nr:HAD family hydrolase [Ornithinibacillus bavariensis]GIO26654.1 histidinol phosphate phosphatase [Ornithinibacillus bavariensis]
MESAIFLDRDGVINEVLTSRVKYVNKPRDFFLLDGVGEAIRLLNEKGLKVFVVTNQGGVGLGYMREKTLIEVHQRMKDDLAEFGARIDDVAYCPHKPYEGCACRKPGPKMLVDLAEKHNVDLKRSYMVGDRDPDIEAGKAAGTKTVLVGTREKVTSKADYIFPDLLAFSKWLVQGTTILD